MLKNLNGSCLSGPSLALFWSDEPNNEQISCTSRARQNQKTFGHVAFSNVNIRQVLLMFEP